MDHHCEHPTHVVTDYKLRKLDSKIEWCTACGATRFREEVGNNFVVTEWRLPRRAG